MIDVNCLQPIFLGNQGENLARTLEFDVSSWLGQYPGAEIVMLVQRPEEDAPYIAVTQVENGVLRWTPTNADTAIAGTGKIMLRLILGEKVRKSAICTVFIAKSLDEPGDAPDPAQAWVDQVIDAANKAEEGAKALLEELEPRIPPADGTPGDVLTKTENGSEWQQIVKPPVKDVQVAGSSVLVDGIANVPIASEGKEGVIKAPLADGTSGIQLDNDNRPCVFAASEADITARQTLYRPLVPARMDYAVKAAMCDGKGAAWTSTEKKAARERMGVDVVEAMAETIAKEPTAQQILAVMQQELTLLNQLVENGMGGSGSLNGFSFSRGENDELIISYVNPDDETDTATSTFATKTLANLIAQELASINESLHTIAGMEQTAQTEG